MCLACEQDAIWLAYLESRGLLQPDDPAAVDKLFNAFPVQPVPMQQAANESGTKDEAARAPAKSLFSCDDPAAE